MTKTFTQSKLFIMWKTFSFKAKSTRKLSNKIRNYLYISVLEKSIIILTFSSRFSRKATEATTVFFVFLFFCLFIIFPQNPQLTNTLYYFFEMVYQDTEKLMKEYGVWWDITIKYIMQNTLQNLANFQGNKFQ